MSTQPHSADNPKQSGAGAAVQPLAPKAPPTTADPALKNVTERGREPGAGVYGKILREK